MMARRNRTPLGTVDWAGIRSRVEAAGRALAGAGDPAPEAARALLDERARALARPATAPPDETQLALLTFALANEVYAVESRYVLEAFRLEDLSPLPGAAPPVFGVTGWRGALLTILDLRAALGLSAAALNDLSRVIVLGKDRPAFGVLADAVHELVTVPAADVREPRDGLVATRQYVRGVTPGAVLVLDAMKLLHLYG